MFGSFTEPIKANKIISYGTRDSQHPIRRAAAKRRKITTGRSPLVSAVYANCLRTTNLLEVIHLGLQNQKRLMHAINDLSTNIRPALLTAVDSYTHWLLVFLAGPVWNLDKSRQAFQSFLWCDVTTNSWVPGPAQHHATGAQSTAVSPASSELASECNVWL